MSIADVTRSVLNRAGLDLHRHRPAAGRRITVMRDHGVRTVLDVGANAGQYGSELRRSGFDGDIVSFEPLDAAFRELAETSRSDERWQCHQLAASDRPGSATINVAGNSASSSLLSMTSVHSDAMPVADFVGRQDVRLTRLDAVEAVTTVPRPLMIKLDVQGHESAALAGAGGLLDQVVLVEAELSVCELYEGAPLMLQSLTELASLGFTLHGLEPGFHDPRDGRILQFDGLFTRTPA